MQIYDLNIETLKSGITTDRLTDDGALNIDSRVNPFLLNHGMTGYVATHVSSSISDQIIAIQENKDWSSDNIHVMVDRAGNYYKSNMLSPSPTQTVTDTSDPNGYDIAKVATAYFKNNIYITHGRDVSKTDTGDTVDFTWWTSTMGKGQMYGQKKSMAVIEDTLYIGDWYKIHTYDGTTAVEDATRIPTEYYITAMVKHTNGRDLVVFAGYDAVEDNPKGGGRVFIFDTVTLHFTQEIEINETVDAAILHNGTIYVTYRGNIGVFTGSGIEKIYETPYNHIRQQQVTKFGDTVMFSGFAITDVNGEKTILRITNTDIDVVRYRSPSQNNHKAPELFMTKAYLDSSGNFTYGTVQISDFGQIGQNLNLTTPNLGFVTVKEIEIETNETSADTYVNVYFYDDTTYKGSILERNRDEQGNPYTTSKFRIKTNFKATNAIVSITIGNGIDYIKSVKIKYDTA